MASPTLAFESSIGDDEAWLASQESIEWADESDDGASDEAEEEDAGAPRRSSASAPEGVSAGGEKVVAAAQVCAYALDGEAWRPLAGGAGTTLSPAAPLASASRRRPASATRALAVAYALGDDFALALHDDEAPDAAPGTDAVDVAKARAFGAALAEAAAPRRGAAADGDGAAADGDGAAGGRRRRRATRRAAGDGDAADGDGAAAEAPRDAVRRQDTFEASRASLVDMGFDGDLVDQAYRALGGTATPSDGRGDGRVAARRRGPVPPVRRRGRGLRALLAGAGDAFWDAGAAAAAAARRRAEDCSGDGGDIARAAARGACARSSAPSRRARRRRTPRRPRRSRGPRPPLAPADPPRTPASPASPVARAAAAVTETGAVRIAPETLDEDCDPFGLPEVERRDDEMDGCEETKFGERASEAEHARRRAQAAAKAGRLTGDLDAAVAALGTEPLDALANRNGEPTPRRAAGRRRCSGAARPPPPRRNRIRDLAAAAKRVSSAAARRVSLTPRFRRSRRRSAAVAGPAATAPPEHLGHPAAAAVAHGPDRGGAAPRARHALAHRKCAFVAKLRFAFQTPSKLFLAMDYYPRGASAPRAARRRTRARAPRRRGARGGPGPRPRALRAPPGPEAVERARRRRGPRRSPTSPRDARPPGGVVRKRSFAGTVNYAAPELLLKSRETYGGAVDCWALGCLLHEMLAGAPPFRAPTARETFARIAGPEPAPAPGDVDEDCATTLAHLLEKDPGRRLAAKAPDSRWCTLDFAALDREPGPLASIAAVITECAKMDDDELDPSIADLFADGGGDGRGRRRRSRFARRSVAERPSDATNVFV
ncbi:serine/threonine kinase [Aureococcus anophagefferens]|nr:serine/threonine kinase [Aureococcus anophagefferens]